MQNCKLKRFLTVTDVVKASPSKPGIIVAKLSRDVIIAQPLYNTQRATPPFLEKHHTIEHTVIYKNLEEPLLNYFPNDRSYLHKQLVFVFFLLNQCARRSLPTCKVEYKLSTFKLRPSKYEIY